MNQQDKKKFIDQLQKNMARSCQSVCKSIKNNECFERCYEKYIRSVQVINQTIKQEGYRNNSMIGYKGYPQPQIEMMHYYNPSIFGIWESYGFAKKWDSSV